MEEEEERPRSEDGGSTSGPEYGVTRRRGVVGFGRIWPCISRDDSRRRTSGAGVDMLEKDMSEGRQVKARTKCASYELSVPSVQSRGYLPTMADFADWAGPVA
jgi:hypothetical protein